MAQACPHCNGEGFFDLKEVFNNGLAGQEGHLVIFDAEECSVCKGLGEIDDASEQKPPASD